MRKPKSPLYCPNGLADITGLPEWLTETHVQNGGATNYTFTLKSDKFPADLLTTDATHTVTFTDKVDAMASDQLIFLLKSSAINKAGAVLEEQSGTTGNSYSSTADNETVSMSCTNTSATSFDLTIPSARGITLSGNDFGWFTVAHTTRWSEGTPKDVFRFNSKTGQSSYIDKELTFTNNIIGGGDFKLKVTAGVFVGAVTPAGTKASYQTYDAVGKTLTLHGIQENVATVKIFAPANLTVSGEANWLKVTPVAASGYTTYTLALQNLTNAAYGGGYSTSGNCILTFKNSSDTTQTTTLNVVLKASNITTGSIAISNSTGNSYSASTSSTGSMTVNAATTTAFTLTVPSPCGTTINTTDYTWFTVNKTSSWTASNPKDVYTVQVKKGDSSMSNKTITISNNMSGSYAVNVGRNTNVAYTPFYSGNGVWSVGNYYVTCPYANEAQTVSLSTALSACPSGWRLPESVAVLENLAGVSLNGLGTVTKTANFQAAFGTPAGIEYMYFTTIRGGGDGTGYNIMWACNNMASYYGYTGSNNRVRCIKNR